MPKAPFALSFFTVLLAACGGGGNPAAPTSASKAADQLSPPVANPPANPSTDTSDPPRSDEGSSVSEMEWTIVSLPYGSTVVFHDLNQNGEVLGQYGMTVNRRNPYIQDGAYHYPGGGALGAFGYYTIRPVAMNDAGAIVGCGHDFQQYDRRAFIHSNGMTTEIPPAANVNQDAPWDSCARNVNNAGDVIGGISYQDESGSVQSRAFVYANGPTTNIEPLPGWESTSAAAINDSGQVAGASRAGQLSRAFVYSDGRIQHLGTLPGSQSSEALDINAAGDVVGYAYDIDAAGNRINRRPFLYSEGAMKQLPMLGSEGVAGAINDHGQITGSFWSLDASTGTIRSGGSFLYSGGKMIDLTTLSSITDLGWRVEGVGGINNAGQILAYGTGSNVVTQTNRTFVLTPKHVGTRLGSR